MTRVFRLVTTIRLTRKDTIAVSYLFSAIRYSNENQSINANTIQGVLRSARHRALGIPNRSRPAIRVIERPDHRFHTTSSPTTASTSSCIWALNSSLTYQLRRALISASYSHGVTGGSGLLAGAETDIATGSVSDQVTRTFNLAWNAGYSRNSGFAVGDRRNSD